MLNASSLLDYLTIRCMRYMASNIRVGAPNWNTCDRKLYDSSTTKSSDTRAHRAAQNTKILLSLNQPTAKLVLQAFSSATVFSLYFKSCYEHNNKI
jgi:hypothetical protein